MRVWVDSMHALPSTRICLQAWPWLWLLVLASVAGSPYGLSAQSIQSARNDFFEIVSLDRRSVHYVNELSTHIGQRAARYLDREGLDYRLPILVRLRPASQFDFEGDHRIVLADQAAVQLDLRWEHSLSLQRTCYLLSKALLLQYSVYNYGPGAGPNIRAWPVAALGMESYLMLRPAKIGHFQQELREAGLPDLDWLLGLNLSDGAAPEAASYWTLQVLRSRPSDARLVRRLFQQALAGVHIGEPWTIAWSSSFVDETPLLLEPLWAAQMDTLLSRELEVVEAMGTSRRWLEALAQINTVETGDGAQTVDLRSLWRHRESETVRELIAARYEILLLRMSRCNPAYFNAARSLGTLFENLLNDAPAHRYLHSLVAYLGDLEDAKEMQAAIERKLAGE
ncbi:MAG: hypothetical protein EA353_14645 [Puniceicoccaceae bacterium]|nr:MAG: hypothetical protein EA353_14645 [Puniceicoccaceae bacterium]